VLEIMIYLVHKIKGDDKMMVLIFALAITLLGTILNQRRINFEIAKYVDKLEERIEKLEKGR
jgi:low affinity Fe/Cu permease